MSGSPAPGTPLFSTINWPSKGLFHFHPERLPEVEYTPDHRIRRVRSNGEIRWQGKKHYLSESLVGQWVGLTEIDNGQWRVDFGPIQLAVYEEQAGKIKPIGC